jgi:hypothetical protein
LGETIAASRWVDNSLSANGRKIHSSELIQSTSWCGGQVAKEG